MNTVIIMQDFVRQIIHRGESDSFYVCDPGQVERLSKTWTTIFPRVYPYYAMKSCNDRVLLATIANSGFGFDCASRREIDTALSYGIHPDKIIFAHTMKPTDDIKYAKEIGIDMMTFDSDYELDKFAKIHPHCKAILRIKSDDPNAIIKLGTKFGVGENEIEYIARYAKKLNVAIAGISFHVGSGSRNPDSFYNAVKLARTAFDILRENRHSPTILDIGGGLFADVDDDGEISTIMADSINESLEEFFDDTNVRVIAEPGRFFSESYATIVMKIIGKRYRNGRFEYFLNDGTYRGLSNVIFEKAVPELRVVRDVSPEEELYSSIVFGQTCDSMDTITTDALLPELDVDDWVYIENWGSYSMVLHTTFNGFDTCKKYYIE
jgi:ornithine decarboxylase